MSGTPRPPVVPGTISPRARDAGRLALWSLRGWLYGTTRGPWRGRIISGLLVLTGSTLFPLLVVLTAAHNARPSVRAYMDPARRAVLGVTVTPSGWRIDNHAAAHPGTGAGAALRALVLPDLLGMATATGTTIRLDASAPALARAYKRELPGLSETGPAVLRGSALLWRPEKTRKESR